MTYHIPGTSNSPTFSCLIYFIGGESSFYPRRFTLNSSNRTSPLLSPISSASPYHIFCYQEKVNNKPLAPLQQYPSLVNIYNLMHVHSMLYYFEYSYHIAPCMVFFYRLHNMMLNDWPMYVYFLGPARSIDNESHCVGDHGNASYQFMPMYPFKEHRRECNASEGHAQTDF